MLTSRSNLVRVASIASLALAVGTATAQSVLRGPVYRPGTNTRYYVLQGGTNWTQLRDFARSMGGDLATINDAAENAFITASVLVANDKVFIGLNDAATEGTFVWSDGSTASYRNWNTSNANNSTTNDFVTLRQADAKWAAENSTFTANAVVEIDGPIRLPGEAATFAAAVTLANAGPREVLMGPGIWSVPNSLFDISTRITLTGSGRDVTTLQSWVGGTTFDMTAPMLLRNMTINYRTAAPMFDPDSSNLTLTFEDCDITSAVGRDSGELIEGLAVNVLIERSNMYDIDSLIRTISGTSSVRFINSVIRDVDAVAVTASGSYATLFTNCTITRVTGSITPSPSLARFVNTVVLGEPLEYTADQLENSLFTSSNPGFVNPIANDFRLLVSSQLIDAGSTRGFLAAGASDATDVLGNNRSNDVANVTNTGSGALAIDIGAYEFQGQIGCSSIDFNNNGVFPEDQDIIDFFNVLAGGDCSQ